MDKELIAQIEKNIVLIIPAYEPDERFPKLLEAVRQIYQGHIVVVDDGSGDTYAHFYEEAQQFGCELVRHYANMGKGRALKDAFNYCLNSYPDMIGCVTADSDGQHTPEDILTIMASLLEHPTSLIMGCRDFSEEVVPIRSKIGNVFMRGMCRYTCGVSCTDTQTGLRGIPRDFMISLLGTKGERFEFETRMLIESKDVYPIEEVKIETVYESKENHQSHYNTVKDSIRIGKIFAALFLKFLLSSLSSTVLDLLLFNALCPVFKPVSAFYYVTIATALARVISAVYNYTINYKLVFNSKANHVNSAARYFGLAVVQMCCSAILVTVGVYLLPMVQETAVKAVVDVSLFFISYFIQRSFVFK